MKKSDAEVTEASDIYKPLGDDIPYGQEDQSAGPPQQIDYLQNMNQMPATQLYNIKHQEC